ncbi:MAG: SDR family oxidoreductase [Pseudomonadota bacterium]
MTTWTLVTGASSGIGRAFAERAAREGRAVLIAARRTDKLEELAPKLTELGAEDVRIVTADLSKDAEVEALWTAATSGEDTVDFLVNNAGLGSHGQFDVADWTREKLSLAVNIDGLTHLMKLAVPHMKENRKGRILNVASIAGFLPSPNMAVYAATKAYVLSLSEAVAEELDGTGVTVTALCPGATESEFFSSADMLGTSIAKNTSKLPSSKEVAEAGWLAAKMGSRIIVPGVMNKTIAFIPRIMPRWAITRITKNVMGEAK